jgi:AcrR family transcriptional regulator
MSTPEERRQRHAERRREQADRRRRLRPSREEIVATAIAIADAEGFEAVSMRRIAQQLRTGTMTLYTYVADKDDLVQLMLDEVMAEQVVPGALPDGWREAIKAVQRQTRAVFLAHPWLVEAMGSRVEGGPNTLRHADQSLGALAGLDIPARDKLAILGVLDDFTLGHAAREIAMAERMKAVDPEREEWLRSYAQDVVASGDYPHLSALGDNPLAGADPLALSDELFERGLEWLIRGIGASSESRG